MLLFFLALHQPVSLAGGFAAGARWCGGHGTVSWVGGEGGGRCTDSCLDFYKLSVAFLQCWSQRHWDIWDESQADITGHILENWDIFAGNVSTMGKYGFNVSFRLSVAITAVLIWKLNKSLFNAMDTSACLLLWDIIFWQKICTRHSCKMSCFSFETLLH